MQDVTESRPPPEVRTMSGGQKAASVAMALVLFLAGLFTLRDFLPAIGWGVILAIGVWPLFRRAAARWPGGRREALPILFVVAIVLVFLVPLALVLVPVVRDAHSVADWIAQARNNGVPPPAFLSHLPQGGRLAALWQQHLGQPEHAKALLGRVTQGGGLVARGRDVGAELVHRLTIFGFTLLILYFLLRDAETVSGQLRRGSKRAFGPGGERIGEQMIRSVHGTVDGLVLVGLAEGLLLGIVYLVVGVPHAALLGFLTALLAMVPFGAAIAFVIAGLIALATGKVIGAAIVVVVGLVISFAADHFVRPKLIGGATRLPFVWVLLGILGGVEAWGLLGLFLGPAIMAALMLLWREWVGTAG